MFAYMPTDFSTLEMFKLKILLNFQKRVTRLLQVIADDVTMTF